MLDKYNRSMYCKLKQLERLVEETMEVDIDMTETGGHTVESHHQGKLAGYESDDGSMDVSSELESDDEDNCIDGVVCEAPLNFKEYVENGEDEVDNMCFVTSVKMAGRLRRASLSESEDSFIVFDKDSDEDESSEESSEEDDDDEEDEEDNDSDEDNMQSEDENSTNNSSNSSTLETPTKKVRFADDNVLCDVHPMIKWAFAYQAARKGPWEEYARDRDRFKRRIAETGRILSTIFQPAHRRHIFDKRFADTAVPMDVHPIF